MRQAAAQAADAIRESILAGRIPAGARIAELDLARQLSVSRTPIREALSRLAAEGLVELSPNRGARVASWTSDELRRIFEVRLRLEPYAVSQAVPLLSLAEVGELGQLARSMLALGQDQAMELVDLNQRFHGLLIAKAGNPALASALTSVTHAAVVRRNFQHYSPGALARSLAHHLEIVAAARANEPDWAEAVMRSHLYNARATMLSEPEGRAGVWTDERGAREPKGAASVWTPFVPTDPPQARGACDERGGKTPAASAPEASGQTQLSEPEVNP